MTSTPPPTRPAGTGAANGFFDSLRRLNTPRSQERWIGGVAGGIAARLGVDPLIVRGVFLVITIFGGFGLLVYGLAWALLPEAADGRIHLQEAIRGKFDAALVGAAIFAVIGLSRVGFWWDGWVGIPFMIGMIALVALAIVVVTAIRNSGSSSGPGGGAPGGGAPPPGSGTPPPGGGTPPPGFPPPTAHPTSPGSVPFAPAHPEQTAGSTAAAGAETWQLTSGEPGAQGASGPWADAHAGGPWAGEGADVSAPDAAAPATEPSADVEPDAAPGVPAGPPEGSEHTSVGETDTSADPASTAHLAADATPTVAYPEAVTYPQAAAYPQTAAYPEGAAYSSAAPEAAASQQPAWPGQPETGDQAAWSTGAGAAPPATPPPPTTPPPQQPPRPPRRNRPGPGKVLVRVTFGLALLVIAGLVLGAEYYAWPSGDWLSTPWLVALGGALVVLGLGATLAGLLGRRSSSLGVVGTLLAIVLVPWAISVPVLTQYNFTDSTNYGDRYWSPQTPDQAADGYSLAAGSIRVDLGDLADQPVTSPIDIELGAGDVELVVPDGMPVAVTASVQGETTVVNLSGWSAEVNGEVRDLGDHTELGWRFGTSPMIAELASPEAEDAEPIPVNIDVGFGAIEVREQR